MVRKYYRSEMIYMERMNNPDETGSVLTSEQTQTIIDTLQQGKDVLSKVTESWQTIKDEIQTVVTKLNEQINDCKTYDIHVCHWFNQWILLYNDF